MCRPTVFLFWVNPNNTYIVQFTLFKIKRVVVKMVLLKTNLLKSKRRRECGKQPPTAHSLFTTATETVRLGFKIHFPNSDLLPDSRHRPGRAGCSGRRIDNLYRTLSSFSLADKLCLVWSFCFPTTDKLSTWLDPYDFCHIKQTVVSIRLIQPWCLFAMQS